jgi:SAM-dependent methyltransferase
MIHQHIKEVALALDEVRYQVTLPEELASANTSFHDDDDIDPAWVRAVWRRMFSNKIRHAGISIPQGAKILDACCGFGYLGEYLIDKYGSEVTFCDLSDRQLSSLKERLGPESLGGKVFHADIQELPFKDESFDFVFGNSFLHHLPDLGRGLHELSRVLKTGGQAVFLHEPGLKANYWETFPLCLVRDTTYNSGFTDLWQFDTQNFRGVFRESGFSDISISGSGITSAFLLNWYFIIMGKMRVTSGSLLSIPMHLRANCLGVDRILAKFLVAEAFPSFMITATKSFASGK